MKTKILLGLILFSIAGYLITACVKDDIYVGPPTIENVTRNPLAPGATDNVTISANISDLKGIKSAKLYYRNSSTAEFAIIDMTAGTAPSYSAVIPAQPLDTVVTYYIEAINVSNLKVLYPANAPTSTQAYTVGAPAIVMNEIFSRGVVGNEDWVELYNSSNTAVDISGYKIYDSGGQSGSKPKMLIPNGTSIGAKGYYVITVDNATTANPEGSSFGLSSSGDEVWLESAAGFEIDHQVVPAMPIATTSYGRTTDGGSTWEILTTVTKNAPNSASAPSISGLAINPTAPNATNAVVVSATITDAQGLTTVKLYYKVNAGSYTSVNMTNVGDVYSGTIPAQASASVVSYYVEATNNLSLASYAPASAPTTPNTYTVAAPPAITGLTISPTTPGATDIVKVSATITDAGTLTSVKLYYKINSGSYTSVNMTNVGNVYSADIPAQVATTAVSYYVEATNNVSLTSYAPATAPTTPASYTVSSLSSITGMTISPTIPTPSDVVTVSATITDVQGITTAELYYKVNSGSYNTVTMGHTGDLYSGNIPAQSAGDVVSYYIKVTNASSLITYSPADALTTPAAYTVAGTPAITNMAKLPATPTSLDQVIVSADVTGVIPTGTVKLYYKVGSGSFTSIDMTKGSGDSYSASIPQQPAPSLVSYYIEAQNSPSLVATLPVDGATTPDSYSVLGPIVLNEVCGKQTPDDDWIEIHNPTTQEIDISGIKLIKNGVTATPIWTAAAGKTIPAGGYIIVPTLGTSDTGYGVLTAGISNTAAVKLELKTSTDIVLSLLEKTASNLGGASGHPTDGSYARVPNATGDWSVQTSFTKGTVNPSSK